MKTIRLIKEELKKMCSNVAFFIVIIATAVIYASGIIYTDLTTMTAYNLFSIWMKPNYKIILANGGVSFETLFLDGPDSYIWMFAPILVSLPFVALLCGAKKNNNIRFELMRVGKKSYILGKMVAAILAGGMAFLLGYFIYGVALYIMMPRGGAAAMEHITWIYSVTPQLTELYEFGGLKLQLVLRLVGIFVFGMTTVVLPFAVSAFIRNKYLVICVPFMMNYFLTVFLEKMYGIAPKLASIMLPTNPAELFRFNLERAHWILLYWLGCVIVTLILHYVLLSRRCDCGE